MAGLVIKDKKPRAIGHVERTAVNELVQQKYLSVSVSNNKEVESQAETFLKKMEKMRHQISTLSKARNVAQELENIIRSDDGTFDKAQISGGPSKFMDLL